MITAERKRMTRLGCGPLPSLGQLLHPKQRALIAAKPRFASRMTLPIRSELAFRRKLFIIKRPRSSTDRTEVS